jgi:hypothetical protein
MISFIYFVPRSNCEILPYCGPSFCDPIKIRLDNMRKRNFISEISGFLGHSSINTTKNYQNNFTDETIKKINKLLVDQ